MSAEISQIKSKKRTRDYGEVFTNNREINAMLDLVKDESERVDSRFLEPACGTGNFLAKILERKLKTVNRLSRKNQTNYERYAILAISSIYGIELLEDNLIECRKRLYHILVKDYESKYSKIQEDFINTIEYLLRTNILHGDALSLKQNNGEPIVFPQWAFINNNLVQRHDFVYEYLMPSEAESENLLSEEERGSYVYSETGERKFFPKSFKLYAPTHFLKLWEQSYGN